MMPFILLWFFIVWVSFKSNIRNESSVGRQPIGRICQRPIVEYGTSCRAFSVVVVVVVGFKKLFFFFFLDGVEIFGKKETCWSLSNWRYLIGWCGSTFERDSHLWGGPACMLGTPYVSTGMGWATRSLHCNCRLGENMQLASMGVKVHVVCY